MPARVIDGKEIASKLRAEIAREAADFRSRTGIVPHLAAVLVGDDPASAVYVRNKQIACEKTGLKSTLIKLPSETTEQELLAWCREHLAAHQVPAVVTFVDRLPRNSVGKLIRAELQDAPLRG